MMFRQLLWMETILSGLISLSAAQPVKVVEDAAAALVPILRLNMEERTARTWGEV